MWPFKEELLGSSSENRSGLYPVEGEQWNPGCRQKQSIKKHLHPNDHTKVKTTTKAEDLDPLPENSSSSSTSLG